METWTTSDPLWLGMNQYQRAAAMALLEAGKSLPAAKNVLGAMINRATASGADLGEQVGRKIYQPSIEPMQQRRLRDVVRSPLFQELTRTAENFWTGREEIPHRATHFLVPENVMSKLEAKNPKKYKTWRTWTGYDDKTQQYTNNVQFRDDRHVFLSPDERLNKQLASFRGEAQTNPVRNVATRLSDVLFGSNVGSANAALPPKAFGDAEPIPHMAPYGDAMRFMGENATSPWDTTPSAMPYTEEIKPSGFDAFFGPQRVAEQPVHLNSPTVDAGFFAGPEQYKRASPAPQVQPSTLPPYEMPRRQYQTEQVEESPWTKPGYGGQPMGGNDVMDFLLREYAARQGATKDDVPSPLAALLENYLVAQSAMPILDMQYGWTGD